MASFNPNNFSYSSLKKFENCPRQYAEVVVYRNFQDVFTSAKGDYGDRLHKYANEFVSGRRAQGDADDVEFGFARPLFEVLSALPGTKYAEYKMAVTADGKPTRWNDPGRWFQGIVDLLIVSDHPTAFLVDYKTGDAKYADTEQLELMALLTFAHFPHVKKVKGNLLFVLSEQMRPRVVLIGERERLWQKYRERDAKRQAAFHAKNFPPRESGLCKKYCVVLSCEHNGRRDV